MSCDHEWDEPHPGVWVCDHCQGVRHSLIRPTDVTPAPNDAVKSLYWLTGCRCDPAWTERKLHAPDCLLEYREDVDEALAAAEARGYAQAIADLRAEGQRAYDRALEAGTADTARWDMYDFAAEYLESVVEARAKEDGDE